MAIKETITNNQIPFRHDVYKHFVGNEITDPDLVAAALKVHAEGYVTMGFVSDEAVSTDGTLDEAIDHSRGYFTDYYLAINPDNSRDMATMRKINIAPGGMVEDLPAFQLSKSGFYSEGPAFLHNLERDGYQIKEIAGLSRTKDASASSVYELLRGVFHDSLTRNEAWFFSIVSSTYDAITRYFGQTAFTVIGDDVKINDYRVNERIQLRPSILMPDNFLTSLLYDIERSTDHKSQIKLIGMFIYLTDGLTDDLMGDKVSNYRRELRKLLG